MRALTRSISSPYRGPAPVPPVPPVVTASLKSYVTSTTAWSTSQRSVAIAFWALFGRSPERSASTYWVGQVGAGASITTCVNTIMSAINGQLILDADNGVRVALVYHHLMGREISEDASGQAYWVSQLNGGMTFGAFVTNIVNAAAGATGFHADTYRHRLLTLESICRLQTSQSYDLSITDSRACVLRVVGTVASYDQAMVDIYRLLVSRTASKPLSWGQALTAVGLYSGSQAYTGSSIRQHRYLVWYNRAGNMMLATAFLPSNFQATAQHRGIVALHGGGWRQGYPEVIYNYCTSLAAGTNPSYVVLAPTYRLTPYGGTSPSPEQDVEDFYTLAYSAPRFKLYPGKIGLFGESSGGHLACLVGAKVNVPRVMALYPPIDMRGNPSVSADLDAYCDYYTPNTTAQAQSSANVQWTPGRLTRFQLWHGLSDGFAPSAQTAAMVTAAGAFCVARYRAGEGHGFTSPVRAEVVSAAVRFFDDRQALDA